MTAALADFCGVNMPNMADFKQLLQKIFEYLTIATVISIGMSICTTG